MCFSTKVQKLLFTSCLAEVSVLGVYCVRSCVKS